MFTKKQLTKLILVNLLITLVAISVSTASVLFFLGQMKDIAHSISEKKKVSAALEQRSETYANMKRDIELYGGAEKHIADALVPIDDISQFITALETLKLQNGVEEVHHFGAPILLGTTNDTPLITSVSYTLEVHATRHALIAYLKNFETLPYFSGISGITITAATPKGINELSTASMNAILYAKQN